jgi:hypothetical protein
LNPDPGSAVLVPVAVLVLLSLVAWGRSVPSLLGFGLAVFCAFGGLAAARSFLPDEFFWPNSPVAQRARWAVRHLAKNPGWESRPVFILLGSSATNFGLDHQMLEKLLAERGTPATVISFAMIGQTHLERRYALETFLRLLGEEGRAKLASAKVTLLHEIFDAYDRHPLYRFEKEAFTERFIQFLRPANAWRGWRAYEAEVSSEPVLPRWPMAALLAHHALLNQLAVGSFSDMKWPGERKRIDRTFLALQQPETGFDFGKAAAAWQNASQPDRNLSRSLPYEQWSRSMQDIFEVMEPYADDVAFFALPVLEPARADYAKAFALALDDPQSPVLALPTEQETSALLSAEFWYDGVHPTAPGAQKFTEWFALRLEPLARGEN